MTKITLIEHTPCHPHAEGARKDGDDTNVDKPFIFTQENEKACADHIAQCPANHKQSTVIPLLGIAQKQNGGWLSQGALRAVAHMLRVPYLTVREVASFYSLFHLEPVGKHHVQVCTSISCQLRNSDSLVAVCQRRIGEENTVSAHNLSWERVSCLGACVRAPLVRIGETNYEHLTDETWEEILQNLEAGKAPSPHRLTQIAQKPPAESAESNVATKRTSAESLSQRTVSRRTFSNTTHEAEESHKPC